MSQERDGQNPAPPAIDVQSVSVTESGGRRKLTALLGSGEGGGNPLAAAQDLLQSLYRGRSSTRTEPEKPVEAEEESSSWWNPFGGGKKKEADDGGGSSWWNPFAKKPANDAAEEPSVKPSESGWAGREFGGARADRSKEYRAAADGAKAGTNQLPPDAKEYIYLVVPGLFTEHYPGYMKDNMARMKKLGLDARMVEIDTDASVEDNAKVIRDTIKKIAEAEGKEVVIIGHSKGGVDTTAAMAQYPELYEHVRAVIAMQTPYGGTPVATDIASNQTLLGLVGSAIKRLFKGDQRALTDLTYQARQAFVHEHNYDASKVATVSYATTGGPTVSTVGPAASYMKRQYGLESDGLVPMADAVVPGSDVVYANDQDHASPVMGVIGRGKADVPGDITEALITVALKRAAEMEAAEAAGGGAGHQ
jgi:triacylglycerol lipase